MEAPNLALLDIAELLLTAEVFNRNEKLIEKDLPLQMRSFYCELSSGKVQRPLVVNFADVEKMLGYDNCRTLVSFIPHIDRDLDGRLTVVAFEKAARWFAGQDSIDRIRVNPVLAFYYQDFDSEISYIEARWALQAPGGGDGASPMLRPEIQARIESLCGSGNEAEELLKLVFISSPAELRSRLDDLVLTAEQQKEIAKACKALEYRSYLKDVGLLEIGKILFVGPPGTGKTSVARSLGRWYGLMLIEVRLSMLISHYLGQTSKNIDSVFSMAKLLAPCILFIDEFDFIAKARTSDDHGAMKRGVNTLLKAIDEISLVEDGVLLLAATNHPQLLDYAAWRRFDKVLGFPLPDAPMRLKILERVMDRIEHDVDFEELALLTEGFSGADLRLVVREAVLDGLVEERKKITQPDLVRATEELRHRNSELRQSDVMLRC